MKKVLKILVISLSGVIILLLITLFAFYFYIKTYWKNYYTEIQLKEITEVINKTSALPNSFYTIHDSLYPKNRHRGALLGSIHTLFYILESEPVIKGKPPVCSSYSISSPTSWVFKVLDENGEIKEDESHEVGEWFSFAIEKYSKPEKCFDYYYTYADISYYDGDTTHIEAKGIYELSMKFYKRELNYLTDKEIAELIKIVEWQGCFWIGYEPLY